MSHITTNDKEQGKECWPTVDLQLVLTFVKCSTKTAQSTLLVKRKRHKVTNFSLVTNVNYRLFCRLGIITVLVAN